MSYGGQEDRGSFLNAMNWTFNSIALSQPSSLGPDILQILTTAAATILRLVSQHILVGNTWSMDDALAVLAMAVNTARAIYVSVAISKGFGRPLTALVREDPAAVTPLLRLVVILQAIGLWTFTFPKLPVAALLIRIFSTQKRTRTLIWLSVAPLVVIATTLTITTFLQCSPVATHWDSTIEGFCWDESINISLGYLAGAYSALLDFSFALYPILKVSKLKMERFQKILVAMSLSLGFAACIAASYKTAIIAEILEIEDPTWATVPLEVWNSVEGCALLVAASAPLMGPLISMVIKGLRHLGLHLHTTIWSWDQSSAYAGNPADVQVQNAEDSDSHSQQRNTPDESEESEGQPDTDEQLVIERPDANRSEISFKTALPAERDDRDAV